jgi:ATP-dependent DNA ligase
LDAAYANCLEEGYEGQMVRLDGPYEQKRSKLLLKRKEFQDAEYDLVRVDEGLGNWAGYGKKAVLRLPDGREFGAPASALAGLHTPCSPSRPATPSRRCATSPSPTTACRGSRW